MTSDSIKASPGTDTMKEKLEGLYAQYNHRRYVHPDPLEFLYDYTDPLEREIVGLIASSLAYGRVAQILKSVSLILQKMNHAPRAFLKDSSGKTVRSAFTGFKHRFTTGEEIASLLLNTRELIEHHGSLYRCFLAGFKKEDETVVPALSAFVKRFKVDGCDLKNSLMPDPDRGSACKRLNLFLRWMVREDDVDPGGWRGIPASKLLIPLDIHMYRICSGLDMTCRKQADMQTVMEITDYFRKVSPEDPVRYDFAITRLGIRSDADPSDFLKCLQV
jgi:uncharacterized protein (TIGR02757 family)